ncbi:glycoside hydrolase family 131 protein [Cadophora sp. DSE1049]|nr:glycoside hydrolase family 131 protein [Cadophora sp. DSE1049]
MKFYPTTLISLLAISAYATPLLTRNPKQAAEKPAACSVKAPKASNNATTPVEVPKPATNGTAAGNATATAPVLPDGRIAQDAVPEDFNVLASKFKSAVVKGDGLVFSDIVAFPDVTQSLFDVATNTKAFSLSINDSSIFVPQGGAPDTLTRRADLLPSIASTLSNIATSGKKTIHFSFQQDTTSPLNLTHDYQIAFLETADFATHQFDVRVGKVVDAAAGSPGADGTMVVVNGNSKNAAGVQTLFSTPFEGVQGFQNFAMEMDFDLNTIQIFHSTENNPLVQVTEPLPNDNSGNGEYHFAVLKNAVGGQQPPIASAEAIVFGGIFMQDTAAEAVLLQ